MNEVGFAYFSVTYTISRYSCNSLGEFLVMGNR